MASFLNKAKDKLETALDNRSNRTNEPGTGNYGPQGTAVGTGVDDRTNAGVGGHGNPVSHTGDYGHTQPQDEYSQIHGQTGLASANTYGSGTNDPGYNDPRSANAGPHSSNLMNKVDPRVDSDRDGRNDPTSRMGGVGNTQHHHDNFGTTGGTGGLGTTDTRFGDTTTTTTLGPGHQTTQAYDHPGSTNTGPHRSNLMNKLDPRTDSDNDGRNDPTSRTGGYGNTQTHQATTVGYGDNTGFGGQPTHTGHTSTIGGYSDNLGHTGHPTHTQHTTHQGQPGGLAAAATARHDGHSGGNTYTGSTGSYDDPRSANIGPHKSNMMNKLDPRVDSDNDNRNDPTSRVGGYGGQEGYSHQTHTGGYGIQEGHSHQTHTGGYGGVAVGHQDSSYTPGSGEAATTAGPHNSNILNKIDPRVDSDLDGSKTYGGNQTFR